MARQFGAESLGSAGYAVRGPVSAAAAAGCALIEVGGDQLGFTSSPVVQSIRNSVQAIINATGTQVLDLYAADDDPQGSIQRWLYDESPVAEILGDGTLYARSIRISDQAGAKLWLWDNPVGDYAELLSDDGDLTYQGQALATKAWADSTKASKSGDTFTGNVVIARDWTSNPVGNTNILTLRRQVSGAATVTDNTPLMRMEHIANSQFPYAGFVINHNTTVPGGNPGGSYLSLGGPTNTFILQFDYLAGAGTPNYQGDCRYMLSGAQSKHIFQVNTGATAAEVGRFDTNGLTAASIRSGGAGVKLGGSADIEFAPTNVDGVTDALIIRNATGQIDVRGDSGLRVRNLANNANANLIADRIRLTGYEAVISEAGKFYGNGLVTDFINYDRAQIQTAASNILLLDAAGELRLQSGRDNAAAARVRSNGGLIVRNYANSADAALTAGAGTFSGNVTVGGATGQIRINNTDSSANWLFRCQFGDLNIEPINGTSGGNSVAIRAGGGFSISHVVGGSQILLTTATGISVSGLTRLGSFTVGTLPSASANTRGTAFVTDSSLAYNSTNLGSTVTGGGSNLVPVWSNGTNWIIG